MPSMRVSTSVARSNLRMAARSALRSSRPALQRSCSLPIFILRSTLPQASRARCPKEKATPPSGRRGLLSYHSVRTRSTHLQKAFAPGFTPAQTSALVIQPLSTMTLRLSLVTGERGQQDAVDLDPLGAASERLDHRDVGHLLAVRERDGRLARDLAEIASVLPDRHGLGAERDAVDRGVVAVLARDRNDAREALARRARRRRRRPCRRSRRPPRRPCCCSW